MWNYLFHMVETSYSIRAKLFIPLLKQVVPNSGTHYLTAHYTKSSNYGIASSTAPITSVRIHIDTL